MKTRICIRNNIENLASKEIKDFLDQKINKRFSWSCKRSQVAMEYLIIIGFVTFAVISIMTAAYFYSNMAKDRIILNQAEMAVRKIINSAESVFYSGEPSKATISVYWPEAVKSVTIQENNIILEVSVSGGISKRAFPSKVKLEGSISSSPGTRKINIQALQDKVLIS